MTDEIDVPNEDVPDETVQPSPRLVFHQHEKSVNIPDPAAMAEKMVVLSEAMLELAVTFRKVADAAESLTETYTVEEN